MKDKKFRLRPRYLIVAALLLLLLLSGAVGKYVQTFQHTETVTFTASLAQSVVLQEHYADPQADGTYVLDTTQTVNTNTYKLIPGVDIPKDPHIVIDGKTDIPAYLYIEIVDAEKTVTIDGAEIDLTSYSVTGDWTATTEIAAKHGGTVYKYKDTIKTDQTGIYILAGNKVEVSQHVKCSEENVTKLITIYAYLVEAASIDNP